MWPVIGGLISGASSLLGGMFSSQTSAQNTQQQIAAQEQMQMQSEQYNTQMANTAYQRGTADMKAAGLNPAMMFGSGGPAPAPTVGTPSVPMPQKTAPLAQLGTAVKDTVNTAVNAETFQRLVQEISNLKTEQALTGAKVVTEQQRPSQVLTETERAAAGTRLTDVETAQKQLLTPVAKLTGATAEDIMSSPAGLRRAANIAGFYGGKLSDVIAPFFSTAKSMRYLSGGLSGGY